MPGSPAETGTPLWAQIALPIAGGIAGAFPDTSKTNQAGTSTTNSQQETNSNANIAFNQWLQNFLSSLSHTQGAGTSTSTTTPNLAPGTQHLIDLLTQKYQNMTRPSLTGYAAQQTYGINRNADLNQQAAQQIMASRGLSTSPVAGTTAANIDASRFGQITNMQAGLPVLQNELDLKNLAGAANFMSMIPHGTTTTGATTTASDTSTNQLQNQMSGGTTAQTGYTGTNSAQNTQTTQAANQSAGGGFGNAVGGIGSMLAMLFSDERLKEDIVDNPSDKAVERIMALRPVEWTWRGSNFKDRGLLAQEVEKVRPDLVRIDRETDFLKVDYTGLLGDLITTVQALALRAEV